MTGPCHLLHAPSHPDSSTPFSPALLTLVITIKGRRRWSDVGSPIKEWIYSNDEQS
jgi:hypothetical protein